MRERNLGRTDLTVSAIGLGCNNFGGRMDFAASERVVHAALDAGVTLFDTADIYGGRGKSEEFLGRALVGRRRKAVIVTKFGLPMSDEARPRNASYDYVIAAAEASLRRLETDSIDLYLLHRPDAATPIEETLRALERLVRDGKVRFIGCSNMPAWRIVDAVWTAKAAGLPAFACCEDQYNLLTRQVEAELLPAIAAHGLSLLPYFPLASGMLTGKYRQGQAPPQGTRMANKRYSDRFWSESNLAIVGRLRAFAEQRGRNMVELAFGWLLSNPLVGCVIAGASTPEQVQQNVAAAGWQLTAEEVKEIDELTRCKPA
jgi:aryl-alcohol dehydrogenase-like predicted oxidoreductase